MREDHLRELMRDFWAADKGRYNRVNPLCESLTDWKEKGRFCTGNDEVTIYDSATIIGNVEIEDHVWIGPFCIIDGQGGLKIGRYTSVAAGCQILTHDTIRHALSGGRSPREVAPTEIGRYCFLGTQSIILKGSRIGDHSLVFANTVVNGEFPSNSIIAGSPASLIGYVVVDKNGEVYLEYT